MVHTPADVVLLAFVALWGLVIVPGLLLWSLPLPTIVELAWSVLYIPPGTVVGIMSRLTTLETDITSSGYKVVVPRRGAGGSVLAVLWDIGALH